MDSVPHYTQGQPLTETEALVIVLYLVDLLLYPHCISPCASEARVLLHRLRYGSGYGQGEPHDEQTQ